MRQGSQTVREASARDRILAAAGQEIARRGVRELRFEQVAQDAGVSVPLVYYHFANRERLVRATLDRGVGELPAAGDTGAGGVQGVVDHLLASLSADSEVRVAGVLRSEALAAAVFDETLRDGTRQATERWGATLASLVRAACGDDVDADRAARQLTALVDGVRERWLAQVVDLDTARAAVERTVPLLLASSPPSSSARRAGAGR